MPAITVTTDAIEKATQRALVVHGATASIASEVARAVKKAEARRNVICGLYYVESYCTQLLSGRVKGDVTPVVTRPKQAALCVDAQFGFAQVAFAHGFSQAVAIARESGICSYAIAHAHTCTSLGYFTEQIAQAGLIGIGFTNASAVVSPPGGTKAVIGTNPIALSVPAKDGGIAFQFDQSTSAVALGKITMAKVAGEKIPYGWAVDTDGQPTDDPDKALQGSLCSAGGYKGWGFGLMAELLAAALTGSVNSTDVKGLKLPQGAPHNLGQYYIMIDPLVYSGDIFWQRLAQLSQIINEQPSARLPGSKPMISDSVEVDTKLWQKIIALGQE